ncbi:MAG: fluoride efflux transporter CrcB [Chlorobi bacterium]|nr:MAG: membrane protein [Chlorobi bacterium OLB7]MBK8910960.1 fluoride efflux transporter CrcB [Chlorobiota bacterium]MBX7216757.1 fluoride efflux transporter CrcB [Candidatus Kapabacteria bacterium]MCE7934576.1 fluoride efflux transporter CrcB [Chlorobi bacterium CHB2]
MKTYLYIAIGAVAGGIARYQLGIWIGEWRGTSAGFPWATLLINISGAFVLGFLFRWLRFGTGNHHLQALLGTGFCGAFTTFSTFSLETVNLMMESQTPTALLYVAASVVLAPVGCFVGYVAAGIIE